jgi:hypothetical protein
MVLTTTDTLTPAQQMQAEARDRYRESCEAHKPLTGKELAGHFGKGPRWGELRIQEVEGTANSETEDEPNDEEKPRFWLLRGKRRQRLVPVPAPTVRATRAVRLREPNPQRRGASFASWIAFGLGITMSVAANVAHIWFVTRPEGQAALYAAMILAAFWPLALAVSVEVISRVGYPHGMGWAFARYGGIGAVGAVAAVVSYLHMHSLLNYFGESMLSAIVGPLGVDGLLIVGGFALFAIGETRKAAKVGTS